MSNTFGHCSKQFISAQTHYLRCKSLHPLPKSASKTKNFSGTEWTVC